MDADIVRDAMLALGRELAKRRKAAGFSSQKKFAPHTGYSRSTVANVETGRQRVTERFWRRCDEVLQTGGVLLAEHRRIRALKDQIRAEMKRAEQVRRAELLQQASAAISYAGKVPRPEWALGPEQLPDAHQHRQSIFNRPPSITLARPTLESDGPGEADTMDRRDFLAASAAAPFAGLMAYDGRPFVTADDVQRIRATLSDLYKLDDQFGGDAVVELATSWLRRVDELLNEADYTESTGRQLQIVFGELARETGWLHFDAGRYQYARYYYGEALRAAQISDDPHLEVLVLTSMNMVAGYQDRPREAIQLAQLAQRCAAGWAPPRLQTLLAAREAVSWAQLGDSSGYRPAMLRAENAFEPVIRDGDPAWLAFFDASQLAASRATAHAYLGQYDQAAAQMSAAVDGVRPGYVRNDAYCRVRLGLLHLKRGDETAACAAVQAALPLLTTVKSGRARNTFDQFRARIRHSRTPAARELLDRAHQLRLAGAAG